MRAILAIIFTMISCVAHADDLDVIGDTNVSAVVRGQAYHREEAAYGLFQHQRAKAILLGLEFLIAGDIIRTVVRAPIMK
jgi:uncharacterized membrane protein